METRSWITRLVQWLKSSLGFRPSVSQVCKLEEFFTDKIALYRLSDPTLPGCVALWRFDHQDINRSFFICVINLAKYHDDVGTTASDADATHQTIIRSFTASSGPSLADSIQTQLDAQVDILGTHLWITGWRRNSTRIDSQGRYYPTSLLSKVQVLKCDLQGVAGYLTGDRYAHRLTRIIAYQIAKIVPKDGATWEQIVNLVNWYEWLEAYAHSKYGIHPEHILQPRRSRTTYKRPHN